tara:strand:+ start:1305 stop:2087 length:783 start_codon:yes stop_codon:yes gene_type:complete
MNDTRFLRNKDLISIDKLDKVTIVGLGGIGSFLVQTLGIMGFKSIRGFDDDKMESHNLSSTAYSFDDVGKFKTECAQNLFYRVTDNQKFLAFNKKFDYSSKVTSKMIVCTDDMESRRMAYRMWWEDEGRKNKDSWFIDARMGATNVEIVTCKGVIKQNYQEHWVPTDSVPKAPCSMKHTVFATTNVASLVASQVHSLVANLSYYDYIWSSLSPINIHYGTLIVPTIKQKEIDDKSTQSTDGLGDNALGTDVLLHWSTENR